MRRVTMQKPVVKSETRSRRVRDERERDTEERARPRPEVRRDVQRTWWPDG
ncbi:hypothetical protein ACQB60_18085 [Actinomycetota bacterium Odt1-20B]